jgi:hypothetical protein
VRAPVLRLEGRNTSILKTEHSPVISFPVNLYLSPSTTACAQRSPAVAGSFYGTKRQLQRIYDAGPLLGVERQRSCDCREGGGSTARDPELTPAR